MAQIRFRAHLYMYGLLPVLSSSSKNIYLVMKRSLGVRTLSKTAPTSKFQATFIFDPTSLIMTRPKISSEGGKAFKN